ncbi:M14 family zinc carboxypeptidase [Hellea sp.]|nr:M14 family zinc carboxypeptidase [Hellea sp.]MDB4844089.1 M14 family zinc carboxypeptidase [Hellea sp.]
MIRWVFGIFTFFLSFVIALNASSQNMIEANYDSKIPTLLQSVGHSNGDRITSPAQALSYLNDLQTSAPENMIIKSYAKSWQGRDLVAAIISSPENIERLDEIKADIQKLADGNLSPENRKKLVINTPAVTWLSYGVHGDEISSTDAGLSLAYHLLATQDDPIVSTILKDTIVIIDPVQNPDGRERFVQSFESSLGLEPLADRYSAEHDQPWPGGRFNHYLF